jgi:hypothetical protein
VTVGYCVKCRERVDMEEEENVTMRNKKKAIRGKCSICGTTIFRIKPQKREGMW